MPIPWLAILDTFIGLSDVARRARRRSVASDLADVPATRSRVLGSVEARLAGVVVAALKEAFDRDSQRLALERAQAEADRRRAERLLRLDQLRQAGEREIGRFRLLGGIAAVGWLGTLFFSAGLAGGAPAVRLTFAAGWLLLLGALASAFVAQSRIARRMDAIARQDAIERAEELERVSHDMEAGRASVFDALDELRPVTAGGPGGAATWLLVLGLAVVAGGVLFM